MKKSIAWVAGAGLLALVGCTTTTERTTTTTTESTTRPPPTSASLSPTMDNTRTGPMSDRGPR